MSTKARLNELDNRVIELKWVVQRMIQDKEREERLNDKKIKASNIIDKSVIDQIKETDNAINELDKSMDRLKEKLFMDNKECEHRHLTKKDIEYTKDYKSLVYHAYCYECNDCGKWIK